MSFPQPLLKLDPLQEMDHLRGVISNEAISFDGIKNALYNLIPSLQKNFQQFVHGFSKTEPAIQLKANERDFMKLLDGRVYLNMAPLITYVPEGMQCSFMEYLNPLKAAVLHCNDNTQKILNDYSVYLAQIITNRQLKHTAMPHDSVYTNMEKKRTELTAAMAKCFKPGSHKAESTYGEVVTRNAEWVDVFQLIAQIEHVINSIRRDDLHKKAEECNRQLGVIIDQIRKHEFEGAGPEVINNLSNGAYQAGAELEFFALVYFRVSVMNNAISDTIKKVSDVLKQQQ